MSAVAALAALVPAADAAAARPIKGYSYSLTKAVGSADVTGRMQSADGSFAQDTTERVAITSIDPARPGTATFYSRRTKPQQGNSGGGSFSPAGTFAAAMTSPFGTCSDGYTLESQGFTVLLTFVTSGKTVFVGVRGNGAPERCDSEPASVLTAALTRTSNGSDVWTTYVPVRKAQFSKRQFTLRLSGGRTTESVGPSGSSSSSSDGTLAIRFKRLKVLRG